MDVAGVIQQHLGDRGIVDRVYAAKLSSMPASMLRSEQESLQFSANAISERKHALGAEHVEHFIKAHQSIDRLEVLARRLDQSAREAQECTLSTPRVQERSFAAIGAILESDVAVLEHVDKVQELLALPELVRDKVLDGEYAQALELAGMTRKLGLRYPKSQLVRQLRVDVDNSIESMRRILLRALREASKLSLLTKAVTYLREMQTAHLETVFIDSRWQFMEQEQWGAIPPQLKRTQPFVYLKRVVDIYREHTFGTINGFRVIFKHGKDGDVEVSLARFARKALSRLLAELREHAPLVTSETERASLWLQLAFCSRSMGRVGADFWQLLDSDVLSEEEWNEALRSQQDTARRAKNL